MEISQEELAQWRQHPTTQKVLKYLHDYRVQVADNIGNAVFQGSEPFQDYIKEAAMRCDILKDICEIDAQSIMNFYPKKEDENEPGGN
jgi:hypothetical protein